MDVKEELSLEEKVEILHKEVLRLTNNDNINSFNIQHLTKENYNLKRHICDMAEVIVGLHKEIESLRYTPEEKTMDELTETLYNSLGINADKLEPQSATKIANEAWQKWAEENVGKFERSNILTKKEQTLSDLYPTMRCATGSCGGCNELYLEDGKGCLGDLFKYTCKKKNITILSNTTPKPENFAKAFKEE